MRCETYLLWIAVWNVALVVGFWESLFQKEVALLDEVSVDDRKFQGDTIQILSVKNILEIPFAISLGWKLRRLFDSRRLHQTSESKKPLSFKGFFCPTKPPILPSPLKGGTAVIRF